MSTTIDPDILRWAAAARRVDEARAASVAAAVALAEAARDLSAAGAALARRLDDAPGEPDQSSGDPDRPRLTA